MTIWELAKSFWFVPLQAAVFLLLTLQATLVIASFREKRSLRIRVLYSLHLLVTFFLYLLFKIFIWNICRPGQRDMVPEFFLKCEALPVALFVLYEAVSALILAAAFLEYRRYRKHHLTPDCIKGTMDLLPVGLAFGSPDGTVVFRNLMMNELSYKLTGKGITSLLEFRKAVEAEHVSAATSESAPADPVQVTLPDEGSVWQITSETLYADGAEMIQLNAADITRQAAITQELEDKNQILRDIHMRLDIYSKQAGRIIIAQELLTARMAVHNEVGNVLLESRHYLKDPSSIDEGLLLQALKNTNTYLLREYEEDDTERDPLTDAMEMAETIGVDVMITGVIPADDPHRRILAAAISECATNTVKHAHGDRLSVDILSTDGEFMYILQNNGIQPPEPIRESGGLLSLRSLVEKEHGTMQTEVSPGFHLTIKLS